MSKERQQSTIRIDLTEPQKQTVKAAIDKNVDAIELTIEELEARIAPKLSANHNESLLMD